MLIIMYSSQCTAELQRSGVRMPGQAVVASQRWQGRLGSSYGINVMSTRFLCVTNLNAACAQNWGGSVAPARLGKLLVPRTTAEVAAAVAAAAAAGRRVRAIGKGHTWTPMFFDADGVRLKLRNLVLADANPES